MMPERNTDLAYTVALWMSDRTPLEAVEALYRVAEAKLEESPSESSTYKAAADVIAHATGCYVAGTSQRIDLTERTQRLLNSIVTSRRIIAEAEADPEPINPDERPTYVNERPSYEGRDVA
jgi:hypothetical protein